MLVGAYQVNTAVAVLATTGVILGAAYMLWLYRRVFYARRIRDHLKDIVDLDKREIAVFAHLVALVLWIGIYPAPFLNVMDKSVENLVRRYEAVRVAHDDPAARQIVTLPRQAR